VPARALRWAVVLAFGVGLLSVPVGRLFSEPVETRASVPEPEWSVARFQDGQWMRDVETYLQESCPLTYLIRAAYNEARFHLGIYESPKVFFGPDGWTFLKASFLTDEPGNAARRKSLLRRIAHKCEELGVDLLVVPVPDKVTVYPRRAFADDIPPAGQDGVYRTILQELEETGIEHLDLLSAMRATGAQDLYYERDSHWRVAAAMLAGQAIRDRFEALGWMEKAGPPAEFVPMGPYADLTVPDMINTLPMRVDVEAGQVAPSRAVARLQETKEHYLLAERLPGTPGGGQLVPAARPSAKVALAGTSFSKHSLHAAVPFYLQRDVDTQGVIGGGGSFGGLTQTLSRIASGESQARVVVWEFVERLYVIDWRQLPSDPLWQ